MNNRMFLPSIALTLTLNIMMLFSATLVAIIAVSLGIPDNDTQPLSRAKRLFIASHKLHWTKGIVPYRFNSEMGEDIRTKYIRNVFALYEKYSCIKFVPWKDKTSTRKGTQEEYGLDHDNYLYFQPEAKCYSALGNLRKNGQNIYCCRWQTCIHEVGHAIGLLHEHTSPLRDKYVRINYENIVQDFKSQFYKERKTVLTDDMYDFDSIMHYAPRAAAIKNAPGPSITFFDEGRRPPPKFADLTQYFYMFKQVNQVYNCTVEGACDNNVQCMNGGYKMRQFGTRTCKCRCPAGQNPRTNCKTLQNKDCGEIVVLDENNQVATFKSPSLYSKKQSCHWYIESPPGTRILLNFQKFNIRKYGGECSDEIAVKSYKVGLYGIPYCGNDFKKTVQSAGNELGFTFSVDTTNNNGYSSFTADVKYVSEEAYCYDLADNGKYYSSHVSYTEESIGCLSWDRVTNCRHHIFNVNDFDDRLEGNYCRNPDNSTGPWCYTKADGCIRKYCDACNMGVCKDYGHCDSVTEGKCGPKISSGCRRSCGFCNDRKQLLRVSATFCDPPELPPDAAETDFKDKYGVGETVKVLCKTNELDFQNITCLSNGQWTELGHVCGACLPGWIGYWTGRRSERFEKRCYKKFDSVLKHYKAEILCSTHDSRSSLVVEDESNSAFLKELLKTGSGNCASVWIGYKRNLINDDFKTADGIKLGKWKNWADAQQISMNGQCVAMSSKCDWIVKSCLAKYAVVCQYTPKDPEVCVDQRSDCQTIKGRNADFCVAQKQFAMRFCLKTCKLCNSNS